MHVGAAVERVQFARTSRPSHPPRCRQRWELPSRN